MYRLTVRDKNLLLICHLSKVVKLGIEHINNEDGASPIGRLTKSHDLLQYPVDTVVGLQQRRRRLFVLKAKNMYTVHCKESR